MKYIASKPYMCLNNRLVALLLVLCFSLGAFCKEEPNEARQVFEEAYDMIFGPEGCNLQYEVNIVGLYKTAGTIWYKGKKSKFIDERIDSYCDGVTAYMVYRKKKTIEVHDANSDKRDKYAGKFKFTLDDFDYSMENTKEGIVITLKQKHGAKGTVKHAKAVLDAKTHVPKHVKIKVAFFWANIIIKNFKAGGVGDSTFVFPRAKYGRDYKYVDKR